MTGIRPKEGDIAPELNAPTTDGSILSLSEVAAKKNVVLYFYPKDDTPGCTREACSFRDNSQKIRNLGAEIIGVSVDDEQSHRRFTEKYHLPFTLVSDDDKRISTAYGVLKETGAHAKRVTFIIQKGGKIAKIFPEVDVTGHIDEVVSSLEQLAQT